MPRGEALAPDAERHLTYFNILKDFQTGRARVVKGLPGIRVFSKDPAFIPTLDFPFYEHPKVTGGNIYSIIVNVQLESWLKEVQGTFVDGPVIKGAAKQVQLNFEFEKVYLDMYLTAHEEAAFKLNDATNPNNILRNASRVISLVDDNNIPTTFRNGIRDTIVGLSYEPSAIDTGIASVDMWPSGPNRGKRLGELSMDFLNEVIQLGSAPVAGQKSRELAAIAQMEKERRQEAGTKAEDGPVETDEDEKGGKKKIMAGKGASR